MGFQNAFSSNSRLHISGTKEIAQKLSKGQSTIKMATKGRPDFRAIIVGGSVAGLTLAHAFEKMGVEYTLLERRDNIAPDLGAGIMICPNGATILDQLGVYETMPDTILGPIRFSKTTTAPGKSTPTSDALGLAEARYDIYQRDLYRTLILAAWATHTPLLSERHFCSRYMTSC